MVENGIIGLACILNGISYSVHHDLIGLPLDITAQKVKALIDSDVSHNSESKALLYHLLLKTKNTDNLEVQISNKY